MPSIALSRFVLAGVLLIAGCALPAATNSPPQQVAASIHLINHGWHSGIAIARADLPDGFPALADFPRADHLEFGWGDAEYYLAAAPTLRQGMQALFRPTPSVLHTAAIDGDVAAAFPSSTIVRLRISADGLRKLLEFIGAEFQRDTRGAPIAVAPGLYGASRFYRANGTFQFPRTCNWWTAEALAAAGVPVEPGRAATARGLLAQAARHGEVLRRR